MSLRDGLIAYSQTESHTGGLTQYWSILKLALYWKHLASALSGWQGGVSALKCVTILLWSRVMWKGCRSFLIAEILTHECHYAITKQRCHGSNGQSIFILVKARRECSFVMSPLPTVKFWRFCSLPAPPRPICPASCRNLFLSDVLLQPFYRTLCLCNDPH